MAEWQTAPFAGTNTETVSAAILRCFQGIYQRYFEHSLFANHALGIEVRAPRVSEGWHVMLLLTPWMLARVFFPERSPGLSIPRGWGAAEREAAPFLVIGPPLPFTVLGSEQKGHLNFLPELGHFLLQPLVLAMDDFGCADEVFAAWDDVIRTRDRAMEINRRECGWQREVSRREFMARLGSS